MANVEPTKSEAKNGGPSVKTLGGQEDEIKHIQLKEIYVDPNWNNRSAALTIADGTEDSVSTGLQGLRMGIFHDGQDEAVVVRVTPTEGAYVPKTTCPYVLVAGFRRYAAIESLNADEQLLKVRSDEKRNIVPNTANGTIRAVVRKLSETDAVALNLRENTQRQDLDVADLVHGVAKLAYSHQKDNTQIANILGISVPYVTLLLRVGKCTQNILKHWRSVKTTGQPATFNGATSTYEATLRDLDDLSKMDRVRQEERYAEAIMLFEKERAEDEDSETKNPGWYKSAKKKAMILAAMFGKLAREKYGPGKDQEFISVNTDVPWVDMVEVLVKAGKTKFNARQLRAVADAMEKSYGEAKTALSDDDDDDEGESETPAKETPKASAKK